MKLYTVFLSLALLLMLAGCESEPKKLSVGDQAPDFTGMSLNQEEIKLSAWRGSPVILRFWSTDCKYCRADTPVFNRYFEQYKDKGLRVVYVNTDNETQETVSRFVQDLEIPFPVILNGGREIAVQYKVKIVPQTIIIDPNGKIITAILGGVGEAELKELVGKYLQQDGEK